MSTVAITRPSTSLERRILLSGLVVLLISGGLLAILASQILRSDMERMLGEQQAATVSLVSAEIAAEFRERTAALQVVAAGIDATLLQQPNRLQERLDQLRLTRLLFNVGVFVTDSAGFARAEAPSIGRVGLNYLDRDHVAIALREGRIAVGKPVIGKRVQAPSFAITVPIRDVHGQVIGAVSGATDLSHENFLDSFARSRYGRTGGYLIIDPLYRLFVTATANNRPLVMQPLPAPGVNPVLDRRLQGFDGSAVNVSSKGIEVLTSSGRIPEAGWFVIATVPTAEAFAPVRAVQLYVIGAALLVTLGAAALMRQRLRQLLAPLEFAAREVDAQNSVGTTPSAIAIAADDEVGKLIGAFNRMLAVAALREAELRVSEAVLQTMQEGVCLVHPDTGNIVFSNSKFEAMFGYANGEVRGMPVSRLNAAPAQESGLRAEAMTIEMDRHGRWQGDVENLRKDGTRFWCQVSMSTLRHHQFGKVWVAVHQDITARVESSAKLTAANHLLESMVLRDALTGTFNRRGLNEMVERQLLEARRSGHVISFVMLDIDHFKNINDLHGHLAGDAVLAAIGKLLLNACRGSDVACRYGGEEFLVVLPRASAEIARRRAEEIRGAVEALKVSQGVQVLRVTVSLGTATYPEHGSRIVDVIECADRALYAAKQYGRNRVCTAAGPWRRTE